MTELASWFDFASFDGVLAAAQLRDSSGTTRGPAIWATTLALALLNVGLALLVVEAIGVHAFAPWWVGGLVLVLGIVAATAAVMLWRAYLANARSR